MTIYEFEFPYILNLPPEVVCLVCDHLSGEELKALRLSCRDLCTKMSYSFGSRFFHSIIVAFHPQSLEVLSNGICSNPDLAVHVRKLTITNDPVQDLFKVNSRWADSYERMLAEGTDVISLGRSFQKLVNLQTICLGLRESQLNQHPALQPKLLGVPLESSQCAFSIDKDIRSGRRHDNLTVCPTHFSQCNRITFDANRINESVMVAINQNHLDHVSIEIAAVFPPSGPCPLSTVPFGRVVPQVKELSLVRLYGINRHISLLNSMRNLEILHIGYLARYSLAPRQIVEPGGLGLIHLPNLVGLSLDHGCFYRNNLVHFLRTHLALCSINISCSTLLQGTWEGVLRSMLDMTGLTHIFLQNLKGTAASGTTNSDFGQFEELHDPDLATSLSLNGTASRYIPAALHALVSDYRTREWWGAAEPEVDFRKANAVIKGLVKLESLEWDSTARNVS